MTQTYKKLFIKTWGCQMNVYDSNRMSDILSSLGYKTVDTPVDADMMILNTCHIREKATDKVFSELGRLRVHKEEKEEKGGKMLIAVAGCVAQAEGEFILERAPYVDIVFGPQTYHELPEMILKASGDERVINTEFPTISKFDHLPDEHKIEGASAFLSIQEGCDKFCTFCVVPYTRGAEYSRSEQEILNEARRLVDQGALEIMLLGQNVNAFHGSKADGSTSNLAELIQKVSEIDGLERIRYSTSHPRDMDDELIAVHGEVQKLMPFLHLPVQSGSDRILEAMNRKHKADVYRDVIEKLRKSRPDIAFSSDYIIGFPGETEQDFEDSMQLARDIGYVSCYSFKYSARPGTPAASLQAALVPDHIASERLQRFQALINEQQYAFNKTCEGKTMPILFDRKGKKQGQLTGRSPYSQSVYVNGNERLIGNIVDVKITEAYDNSMTGDIVMHDDKAA
ncbi:MAG: tRNA (N6-isopentenyl adenosine(37)-C2)-methylthiotransferase MiaB [Zetaproteobacteria bacterium]|nr:MAG: tRNA (N6-isopentenyl adenosine(37)-C2)-methylthiotransferase MiaB [Zetaproteobacteria bacterium]